MTSADCRPRNERERDNAGKLSRKAWGMGEEGKTRQDKTRRQAKRRVYGRGREERRGEERRRTLRIRLFSYLMSVR